MYLQYKFDFFILSISCYGIETYLEHLAIPFEKNVHFTNFIVVLSSRLRAACMNMPATPVAQGPNKKGPTLPPSSSSVVQPPSFDTTVSFRGEQRER